MCPIAPPASTVQATGPERQLGCIRDLRRDRNPHLQPWSPDPRIRVAPHSVCGGTSKKPYNRPASCGPQCKPTCQWGMLLYKGPAQPCLNCRVEHVCGDPQSVSSWRFCGVIPDTS